VGGPGGVLVWNEVNNRNGYEVKIISDGKFDGTNQTVLWARRVTAADGKPRVEFKFNLAAFNLRYPTYAIDPNVDTVCVVFEATRGLKGGSNYLWNDKYNFAEAGNPYATVGLQNIYELDTLPGCLTQQTCACPPTSSVAGAQVVSLTSCKGDLTRDGVVGEDDLVAVIEAMSIGCEGCAQDLNRDGVVNEADVVDLLGRWGACKPLN